MLRGLNNPEQLLFQIIHLMDEIEHEDIEVVKRIISIRNEAQAMIAACKNGQEYLATAALTLTIGPRVDALIIELGQRDTMPSAEG